MESIYIENTSGQGESAIVPEVVKNGIGVHFFLLGYGDLAIKHTSPYSV
jgi:hypothetical protein